MLFLKCNQFHSPNGPIMICAINNIVPIMAKVRLIVRIFDWVDEFSASIFRVRKCLLYRMVQIVKPAAIAYEATTPISRGIS